MKSRIFPVAVITHILVTTLTAHAAATAAAPVTQLPTKVEIASPPAPAIPSPLAAAKLEYSKSALIVESNIQVVLANGESCGMIGTQIVSNLKEKNALKAQTNSRKQIESLLADADKGDEKKKALAKKRIDQEISSINEVYKQVDDNLQIIQSGLDTPTKTCQRANKAFFLVRSTANSMVKHLSSAKKALSMKKANLLTDGAAAYASAESTYDNAAAQSELRREQAEERSESASAELN